MTRFSLRFALVAIATAAVFGAACGDAQEGHISRSGASTVTAFGPGQPALRPGATGPLAEAPPPARTGPGAKGSASDGTPASAPPSVTGQTSRKVDTPTRFAAGLAAQNSARSEAGQSPLVWSLAREEEARSIVNAAAAVTCSRAATEKMGVTRDVAAYWAPGIRQLDGTGAAQDLSSSFVVSEWLQERASYSATGCNRKGACENYSRMIKPAARGVGCAVAVCSDKSQVWACRFGD